MNFVGNLLAISFTLEIFTYHSVIVFIYKAVLSQAKSTQWNVPYILVHISYVLGDEIIVRI